MCSRSTLSAEAADEKRHGLGVPLRPGVMLLAQASVFDLDQLSRLDGRFDAGRTPRSVAEALLAPRSAAV
jgi:hypothetical protein